MDFWKMETGFQQTRLKASSLMPLSGDVVSHPLTEDIWFPDHGVSTNYPGHEACQSLPTGCCLRGTNLTETKGSHEIEIGLPKLQITPSQVR